MSMRDRRDIDEWLTRWWWPWSSWEEMTRLISGGSGDGISRKFEEMKTNMERMFEETIRQEIDRLPKELIRQYRSQTGGKVMEIGPLVYGYSVIIGSDGKSKVRQFGNI